MEKPGRPDELTAQNEADFIAMKSRIQAALKTLRNDRKLKPTGDVLCDLANCSRGTLYNHRWSITELKAIRDERKPAKTGKPSSSPSKPMFVDENSVEGLQERLRLSRDTVGVWKRKYDIAQEKLSSATSMIDSLVKELTKLRQAGALPPASLPKKRNTVVDINEGKAGRTNP